jgi:hypothetical protein
MPEFRLLWTALPRRVDGNELIIDAFVSPRLGINEPPGSTLTLADFPALTDWPSQVANHLAWDVEFSGGATPVAATRVPLTAAESDIDLDQATWTALFPATIDVTPWSLRSVSARPFYSYPVGQVVNYITDTYKAAAIGGPDPTTDDKLDQLVNDGGNLIDTRPEDERAEPTSHTEGGETTGGGALATSGPGCLFAPLAWLIWLLRWLWHKLIGGPAPGPAPKRPPGTPPPISATPIVVTYETAARPTAPDPPSLAAVEQHVADHGITPPEGWTPIPGQLPPGATPPTANGVALAAAWRFFKRPETEPERVVQPDITKVPPSPTPPKWDFHQRLGVLGDYARLMRRLGIVIRLRVPAPVAAPTTVRIIPRWDGQPMPQRDLTPATRCVLSGSTFAPEPLPGSEFKDGTLDLAGATDDQTNPSGFRLLVVDADGAALKLIHTAASLVRYRWMRSHGLVRPTPRAEGLASLRNAGIAVIRRGRAGAIKTQVNTLEQAALATTNRAPEQLSADDIVRGFRVEVQDVTDNDQTPWRSLCTREGRYFVLDQLGAVVGSFALEDEGYIKRSGATSADHRDSQLYVHETLLRWDGWSLVAPRPGRKIRPVEGTRVEPDGRVVPTQTEEVVAPIPEPHPDIRLATSFQPTDGSLPMLRIGRTYRFRVSLVDLAGERIDAAANAPVSGEVTYRRFEPLAPPALLPLEPYRPGESLEVLVIRSSFDQPTSTYVPSVLEPADSTMQWRATATRHVFPAKVTQEQSEQHGRLDTHPLNWRWRASLRADNTFDNPQLVDLDDGTTPLSFGNPGIVVIEPSQDAVDGKQERYAVNGADNTLPTPYLPDPFAESVALRKLPGAKDLPAAGPLAALNLPGTSHPPETPEDEKVTHVPFGAPNSWPQIDSFRIRVAERPGTVDPATGKETFDNPTDPPHWDPATRLLTVFLAKGEVVQVPFSTRASPDSLANFATVRWLSQLGLPDLDKQIELGCHWMVSPSRTLTLVHAVQRPLRPADLLPTSGLASKEIGATVAKITAKMALDPVTTGQVTLLAKWTDEHDDGTTPTLISQDASAVLETFAVPLGLDVSQPTGADFPPVPVDPPTTVDALHEFGDTRHRMVHYRLKASTRFREYFPPTLAGPTAPDGSDGFSRTGAEIVVSVKNSVPPIAPAIRYVMPSYGWDTADPDPPTSWTTFTRRRVGGGIRVFLDRPWYTTGPGEQVGVVLPATGTQPNDTRHTFIGVDPTTANLTTPDLRTLDPSIFSGGKLYPGIKLEDDSTVDIVGYTPALDTTRNQWYADITLDMGKLPATYAPFARLALVRFQPESEPKTFASKPVLAEFVQLAPDRELTATVSGNNVDVVVRGRGPRRPHPNAMLIALDEADDTDPDEMAWRPLGTAASSDDLGDDLHARLGEAVLPNDDPAGHRWEKTLTLPGPRGDRPLRIIVREIEFRATDEPSTDDDLAEVARDAPAIARILRRGVLPRIVYADAVRLA